MSRWTLRQRLVAVLIGLLTAVTATIGVVSTLALQGFLVDRLDEQVLASSRRAVAAQDGLPAADQPRPPGPQGEVATGLPPGLDAPGQGAGTVTLTEDDGELLGGYIGPDGEYHRLTDAQAEVLGSVEPDGQPRTVELGELGGYRIVAASTADGDLVVTGLSTEGVTSTVGRFLATGALIAALGIAAAVVAGGALVRRELRPLERVAATAIRVSELPLHRGEVAALERVPDADTDPATEVGKVGTALNRLLGHVEGALAARQDSETQVRQFVADASHELRTPLASIRGYAELVRRMPEDVPGGALHAMERVESESRRMTSLVEDMLLLARLDAGRPLERAPVDLTALVVDAVADAHAAGPERVWRLDLPDASEDPAVNPALDPVPDDSSAVVLGDEDRLRQVLVNLLANARVHTPAGTTVRVSVLRVGDTVTLRVQDDGPGISAELLPHLFRRFTRGDAARSPGGGSSGLGLSIVDAVVRAHHGRIEVDGSPGATAFTVLLPAHHG